MTALLTALDHLLANQRDADDPIIFCSDSRSALAALREGPAAQRTTQGASAWRRLLDLTAGGRQVRLQWVPSHCGIPGNDAADALAREAAALPQTDAPLDMQSVYRAAVRWTRERVARTRPHYEGASRSATGWYRELMGTSFPPPISNMDRTSAIDVHQMRSGRWSGSTQFLHEIGKAPTPDCLQCRDSSCAAARCPLCGEEADTPRHILLTCPGLMGARLRCLGSILPGPEEVRRADVVAALVAVFRALQSR